MTDITTLFPKLIIYNFCFPDKSVYIGYARGELELEFRDKDHRTSKFSPVYHKLIIYPEVKPKIEEIFFDKTRDEMYELINKFKDQYKAKDYTVLNDYQVVPEVFYRLEKSHRPRFVDTDMGSK